MIGSPIAGVLVCLVALSVSLHVCLATIGFFWVYRLVEGPRIIGRAVKVPALVTVVAVLQARIRMPRGGQFSPAVDNQVKLRLLRDPPVLQSLEETGMQFTTVVR